MSKGRHASAFESMCRLRFSRIQAARDQFYMHKGLEAESSIVVGRNKIAELITVPRNRRAMQASELVMFMQQYVRPSHFTTQGLSKPSKADYDFLLAPADSAAST